LQLLTPFKPWDGADFEQLPILVKAEGKCTTDHISPAGKWLQYRGHLDKISDNLFMGVRNAFRDLVGEGINLLDGSIRPYSEVARYYKAQGLGWVVVADENYGEGSSREHAAMEPRYLGCKVVIAKSFARIHETNLKKQGILALSFIDKEAYARIQEADRISIYDLEKQLHQGNTIKAILTHIDKTSETLYLQHTYNQHQLGWFTHGSALNMLMRQE
jgi:aconitate hydratase